VALPAFLAGVAAAVGSAFLAGVAAAVVSAFLAGVGAAVVSAAGVDPVGAGASLALVVFLAGIRCLLWTVAGGWARRGHC
jgi:hypothetical protein